MNPYLTILIFFVVLFILAIIAYKIGNNNARKACDENKFNFAYKNLQCILNCRPVTEKSYYEILEYIGQVQKYKYINEEKMDVFKTEFKRRYQSISDEILSSEDDMEALFYDTSN